MKIKKAVKNRLPFFLVKKIKRIVSPPSEEYKWLNHFRKTFRHEIKNEIVVSKEGDFYLRSDFGFDFLIDINDEHLRFDTCDDKDFKFLLEYLSGKIPENPIVFDIGAFTGGYSLAVAGYFPKSKIYSFEPVNSSYQNFIKNVNRNNRKNIFPFRFAVSDKSGEVIMSNRFTTGNHILSDNEKVADYEKIPSVNLDEFVLLHGIENVSFIKCDVEGHEMAVLNGALKLLNKYKPVLYIEIKREWTLRYGNIPEEIINKLLNIGYKCYLLNDHSIVEITDIGKAIKESVNFLFMSEAKQN